MNLIWLKITNSSSLFSFVLFQSSRIRVHSILFLKKDQINVLDEKLHLTEMSIHAFIFFLIKNKNNIRIMIENYLY